MQGENKFLPKLRGKPQEEKLKFRPKFKQEDEITMDLTETECESMQCATS